MKKNKFILFFAVVVALLLVAIIYKGGILKQPLTGKVAKTTEQKDILYWTCGMHPQVKQDKPGKCPVCSMALIPVYSAEGGSATGGKETQEKQIQISKAQQPQEEIEYFGCGIKEEGHCPHCDEGIKDAKCICGGHSFLIKDKNIKVCPVCKNPLKKIEPQDLPKQALATPVSNKILYYRNPMHPEITSPTPMKDEMGMDYVPVYEEAAPLAVPKEEGAVSRVHLNQTQLQLAGIKTEPLSRQKLSKEIRTVGKIAYDPELAVAQEEFLTALETQEKVSQSPDPDVIARAKDIVEKSKFRLRLLGMSDDEISQLEKDRATQLNLVLPEDKVWVYAEVYEYDLSWVKIGQETTAISTAYPGEEFKGAIKSISPVLNPATRSARVRIEVNNPEKKLKPEMYVDVVIQSNYKGTEGANEVLAVPKDAVLDTGLRKIVYVDAGNGIFLGKEIKIGPAATTMINGIEQTFYPVLSGLNGDEIVVTKGNFLIDSQSQLTGGMSVLWGGASEIKTETPPAETQGKIETQHKH